MKSKFQRIFIDFIKEQIKRFNNSTMVHFICVNDRNNDEVVGSNKVLLAYIQLNYYRITIK